MRNRFTKIAAGLAALAALALGGATLASAGQGSSQPATPTPAATVQGSADAGAVTNPVGEKPGVETADAGQKADTETPDGTGKADTDSIQDQNGKDDTTEPAGAESGTEQADSGSEAPGNDGPGGHADEPANPNAAN